MQRQVAVATERVAPAVEQVQVGLARRPQRSGTFAAMPGGLR
jgi:hypothetical protein